MLESISCDSASFIQKLEESYTIPSEGFSSASSCSWTCFLRVVLRLGSKVHAPPIQVVIIGLSDDRKGLVIKFTKKAIRSTISQSIFSFNVVKGWRVCLHCCDFKKVLCAVIFAAVFHSSKVGRSSRPARLQE